jgi:hypothetical protein
VLLAQEKYREALDWFDRAAGLLADVRKKAPEDAIARNYHCNTCTGRARTLSMLGRHKDAVAGWDQALELADDKNRCMCRIGRAVARARGGDHTQAAAEAAELAQLVSLTAGDRYDLACAYALAARAVAQDEKLTPAERQRCVKDHSERSIRLLEQAADKGYFNDPQKQEQLKKDKDLDAVRIYEEYRKLEKRVVPGSKGREK